MIVYLARDICPFVMYCVNGKPPSSLLIESTDSMISSLVGGSVMIIALQSVTQFIKRKTSFLAAESTFSSLYIHTCTYAWSFIPKGM